ncbi:MAG: glycosyltransferase [Kiritimatiellae bacterium]|nr:glycosyltransferase [Kiritimatiellia bacterium]
MSSNEPSEARPAVADWPAVSVIVITKGRHALAERAVDSILAADYEKGKRQIVVLEETDAPTPIEGNGVDYHTIPVQGLGFGHARNKALEHAKHDIVAFTDDDCQVEEDWLRELIRPLMETPDAAASAGAVLVPACGAVGQCENILGFPGGGVRYVHAANSAPRHVGTFSTCNCAVRRSALSEPIEFPESLRNGGEDAIVSRRIAAEHPIVFTPFARVRHAPRDSLRGVFRWFVRRGVASVQMTALTPSAAAHVRWMLTNSPCVRLAGVVAAGLVLGVAVPGLLGALLLLYYGLVLWRFRWARRYYPSLKTWLMVPLVKATMDAGMDVGIAKAIGLCVLRRQC